MVLMIYWELQIPGLKPPDGISGGAGFFCPCGWTDTLFGKLWLLRWLVGLDNVCGSEGLAYYIKLYFSLGGNNKSIPLGLILNRGPFSTTFPKEFLLIRWSRVIIPWSTNKSN